MSDFNIKIYHPHHQVVAVVPNTPTLTTTIDYDLSIIIPIYQNAKILQLTIPLNYSYFRQLGVELVIVVDEPLTIHDFDFLSQYSDLSYTVIVNKQTHKKRSISTTINVGLRHAVPTKQCVLILAPEFIFDNNVIDIFYRKYYQLMSDGEMINEHQKGYFLTGSTAVVTFSDYFLHLQHTYLEKMDNSYQSPIFASKQDLIAVGGYHESLAIEDNVDEELYWRLNKYGYFHSHVNETHLIYIEMSEKTDNSHTYKSPDPSKSPNLPDYSDRESFNPIQKLDFNFNGIDFNTIIIKKTTTSSINNTNDLDFLRNNPSIVDFRFGTLRQHYLVMGLMIIDQNQSINSFPTIADGIIILDNSHNNEVWTRLDQQLYTLKIKVDLNENALSLRNFLLEICQKLCFPVTWFLWIDSGEEIINTSGQLQLIKNRLKCESNELLEVNLMGEMDVLTAPTCGQLGSIRLFKNNVQKMPYKLKPDPKLNYRTIPYDSQLIGSLPLNIMGMSPKKIDSQ